MGKIAKKAAVKSTPKVVATRKSLATKKLKKSMASPKSETIEPQIIKTEADIMLKPDFVKIAYQHLQNILQEADNKSALFDDEQTIFLQINTIKIPKCPAKTLNIDLEHSVLPDEHDIVLITNDLKNQKKTDYEKNVEYHRALLDKNDIQCVKEIIPFHQLKAVYSEFEMQNKLVGLYDMFMIESSVHSYVMKAIGHMIDKRKKLYGVVDMQKSNLKQIFDRVQKHTDLHIHSKGDTYSVRVGHTGMTEDQVVDNVMATVTALNEKLPGGFINVKGLYLKAAYSKAIQFYLSCINPNPIKVPAVKQVKLATNAAVIGELSTQMDAQVTVLPSGDILIKSPKSEYEMPAEDKNIEENPEGDLTDTENTDIKVEEPRAKRNRKKTPVPEAIIAPKKVKAAKMKQSNKENENEVVEQPIEKKETSKKKKSTKEKAEEKPPLETTTKTNAKKSSRNKKDPVEPVIEESKPVEKAKRKPKKEKVAEELPKKEKEEKVAKPKATKGKAEKKENGVKNETDEVVAVKKKSPKRKAAKEHGEQLVDPPIAEKKRGRPANKKATV